MLLQTIAVPTIDQVSVMDAIVWDGKSWIVTFWINTGIGWHQPSRLIRFDNLAHSTGGQTDHRLHEPLPEGLHASGMFGQGAGSMEQIDYPKLLVPDALIAAQKERRALFSTSARGEPQRLTETPFLRAATT